MDKLDTLAVLVYVTFGITLSVLAIHHRGVKGSAGPAPAYQIVCVEGFNFINTANQLAGPIGECDK